MKRCSSLAIATLFVLAPFAAADKPADPKAGELLIGKWEVTEGEIKGATFEYTKTGDAKFTFKSGEMKLEMAAKYKVLSEDSMELTFKGPDGKDKTEKGKFKIEKDTLTLTDPSGKAIKLMKAK